MTSWDDLSEEEQLDAIDYAFTNATEIDRKRFRKICAWRGDGRLVMSLPQWVCSIFNRSADE